MRSFLGRVRCWGRDIATFALVLGTFFCSIITGLPQITRRSLPGYMACPAHEILRPRVNVTVWAGGIRTDVLWRV